MEAAELFLLSMSLSMAITFVAVCIGIYYTHRRTETIKLMNDTLNKLLESVEEDEERLEKKR